MFRDDFRSPAEGRLLQCTLHPMQEGEGSAMLQLSSMGGISKGTALLSTVYGPATPRYSRHELFDRASLDIEVIPPSAADQNQKVIYQNKIQQYLSKILSKTILLNQFPRMIICIKVTILYDDGNILASALNAAVLALLASNIPMISVPIAACVAVANGHCLLDPTLCEIKTSAANITSCFIFGEDDEQHLIHLESIGSFNEEELVNSVNLCKDYHQHNYQRYKQFVKDWLSVTAA